jgi:hypothetical protein
VSNLIEDLSKKCYTTGPLGRDGWPEYVKFDHQKFAELIIEECTSQCWTVSELEYKGDVVYECSKRIRKHFGVEQ